MRRPNFVNLAAEEVSPFFPPLSPFCQRPLCARILGPGRKNRASGSEGARTARPAAPLAARGGGGPAGRDIRGRTRRFRTKFVDFLTWGNLDGVLSSAAKERNEKKIFFFSLILFFLFLSCSAGEEKNSRPVWPGTPRRVSCSPGGRQVKIRRDLFWSQLPVNGFKFNFHLDQYCCK